MLPRERDRALPQSNFGYTQEEEGREDARYQPREVLVGEDELPVISNSWEPLLERDVKDPGAQQEPLTEHPCGVCATSPGTSFHLGLPRKDPDKDTDIEIGAD